MKAASARCSVSPFSIAALRLLLLALAVAAKRPEDEFESRLFSPTLDCRLPAFIDENIADNRSPMLKVLAEMDKFQAVLLFDRLMAVPHEESTIESLRAHCPLFDFLYPPLLQQADDQTQFHSCQEEYSNSLFTQRYELPPALDELVREFPRRITGSFYADALNVFKKANRIDLLKDPEAMMSLLEGGVRFPVVDFLEAVGKDLTDQEIARVSPLLVDAIWLAEWSKLRCSRFPKSYIERFGCFAQWRLRRFLHPSKQLVQVARRLPEP
jgi:hypothetical protein